MARKLSAATEEAVRARVGYFRDLGVFDFYRRDCASSEASEAIEPDESTPTAIVTREGTNMAASAAAEEMLPMTAGSRPVTMEEPRQELRGPVAPQDRAPQDKAAALEAIREEIGDCQRCALAKLGRHTIVFGDGDANARLLFVGEGPGADEDAQGLPFVGRAGQLLNNMINAMGLQRDQVYIANIVKCRPPQNRVPEPQEAHTCSPFLFRQIDAIGPEVIVALGATAATYLLGGKSPLSALRGRIHEARGTKLIVTYHPAYLLRDPRQKKEAWADLQIAMRELGLKKSN